MCHGACMEVTRQREGVSFLLPYEYCVGLNTSIRTSVCQECVSIGVRKKINKVFLLDVI